jgi:hypothetical protein
VATALTDALLALARVAEPAGVPPAVARAEGAALAAAVAESAPRAHTDWVVAVADAGGDARTTQDFFDAAVRARRWRDAPTTVLATLAADGSPHAVGYARALAEVASAACGLGESTIRVVGNASLAAAAQLRAAGAVPRPGADPVPPPGSGARQGRAGPGSGGPGSRPVGPVPGAPPAVTPGAPPAAGEGAASAPTLAELLAQLDALVGLDAVKREVHRQAQVLRVERLRSSAGLRNPAITRHLVFVGNPGTGKTTVARLVAGIYRSLGLLSGGQLVEVDRSELVAGYLGQTATRTAEVVTSALGGVLFVDEAYSLAGDQYGDEAVDTLVKEMEDHRDDLVVIVAGYPGPMAEFVATNPGLASRFRTVIEFDDYSEEELVLIFERLATDADFVPGPGCLAEFRRVVAGEQRGPGFGNGRFARNCLEAAIGRHAWRLREVDEPTLDQLRTLLPEDLREDPHRAGPPAPDPPADATVPEVPSDAGAPGTPAEGDITGNPGAPGSSRASERAGDEPRDEPRATGGEG